MQGLIGNNIEAY